MARSQTRTRGYTKKDTEYWNSLGRRFQTPQPQSDVATGGLAPSFDDNEHFTSATAACNPRGGAGSTYRDNPAQSISDVNAFSNIKAGILPYTQDGGYYSMGDAINVAILAYFNVAIVRNTINLIQDFSVSPLHIKTSNKTVKNFLTKWFEAINLSDFMSQFFLEYYRSGNVFIYKFNGQITDAKFNSLQTVTAAKKSELPIRYIILNPSQIYLQLGPTYDYNFSKMLSTYELERLRNPKTPEDVQVFNDFPKTIQQQIKQGGAMPYVYAPLDTNRLYYAFYRKQSYEPLAVPMIFPVLNDIEFKLELKQMDRALARSMEQMMLLVTAGESVDKNKGVPAYNPANFELLKNMFKNQTVGRVLVADWTTKAEWKIPDLKELLGEAKYARVDRDIREGLQYMFFGDEKFANASVKSKMFIESLREGRRVFLDNFLRPEVKKVCETMGFKNVPTIEFEDIDLGDDTAKQRLLFQMAQTGLLTDTELNNALKTGLLPDKESSLENQRAYKKERDAGLYQPLIGGSESATDGGRPAGKGKSIPSRKAGKIGVKANISQTKVVSNVLAMNALQEQVEAAYKKTYKKWLKDNGRKDLDDTQKALAQAVAKAIILNEPEDKWTESVAAYVKDPKDIPEDIGAAIDEIGAEFDVTPWEAIVLYRSQIE